MSNPTALVLTYSNQTINGKKNFTDDTTINKLEVNNLVCNNIITNTLQITIFNKKGSETTNIKTPAGSPTDLKRFEFYPTPWRVYLIPGTYGAQWAMNSSRAALNATVKLIYKKGPDIPGETNVYSYSPYISGGGFNPEYAPITFTTINTISNVVFANQETFPGYSLYTLDDPIITFTITEPQYYSFGFTFDSGTSYGSRIDFNYSILKLYSIYG